MEDTNEVKRRLLRTAYADEDHFSILFCLRSNQHLIHHFILEFAPTGKLLLDLVELCVRHGYQTELEDILKMEGEVKSVVIVE